MPKFPADKVRLMAVNPYTKGKITDTYPHLSSLVDSPKDADKYFRYLSFVFDPHSPMVIDHPDLETRRAEAARETGYTDAPIPEWEVAFITRVVRRRLWTLYCCYEKTYDDFASRVTQTIETDIEDAEKAMKAEERKIKLLEGMSKIEKEMPELLMRLFEGDNSLSEVAEEITDFSPENIGNVVGNGSKGKKR